MQLLLRAQALIVAAVATALAIVALAALRAWSGGEQLLWLVSGLAVACLHMGPVRRWPAMLAALFAGHVAGRLLTGLDWAPAIGLAVADNAGAVLCACLGIRLLPNGLHSHPPFRQLGTVSAAAGAGAAAATLLALPFIGALDPSRVISWFMANLLGNLTVAPIVLFLYERLSSAGARGQWSSPLVPRGMWLALAIMFVLALGVFSLLPAALLFLLVVPLAIAVVRCGYIAASSGVLVYALAARIVSAGEGVPPSLADLAPGPATIILQLALLLMLAAALPLSALLRTYDLLQATLRRQNAELSESLKILTMAEKLAGIGRWRWELKTGRQEWSPMMLEMNGLSPDLGPDPGDVTALLPDGGAELFGNLARHRYDREPYSFEYTTRPQAGADRHMRIVVSNEFDENGKRTAVFGVAMDITVQVYRERALQAARQHALDLAAEAQKLALTDPLTGLANRRSIFTRLSALGQAVASETQPLTLVLFDIDHFKRVNDRYGHQMGDEVLQRVAELTRRQVRRDDLVGRIGGEEFVWLLPGVDAGRARELAERLREMIERESPTERLPGVTISIGMALLRHGDTPERLIARADQALYRAKASGRNCVRRAA